MAEFKVISRMDGHRGYTGYRVPVWIVFAWRDTIMKFGAYCHSRKKEMVWFRTQRSLETGFYHRHSLHGDRPGVYVADRVPDLIMNSYPWLKEAEDEFQLENTSSECSDDLKSRQAVSMADYLVQRLDPNDPKAWVAEPHWLKHLKSE